MQRSEPDRAYSVHGEKISENKIKCLSKKDGESQRELPKTKQIQDLQAERDHLHMISQMKSEQIREALQIMRLLLEEINMDVKAEITPKNAINPMQQ